MSRDVTIRPPSGGVEDEHPLHIPGHGHEAPLAAHFFEFAQRKIDGIEKLSNDAEEVPGSVCAGRIVKYVHDCDLSVTARILTNVGCAHDRWRASKKDQNFRAAPCGAAAIWRKQAEWRAIALNPRRFRAIASSAGRRPAMLGLAILLGSATQEAPDRLHGKSQSARLDLRR